MMTDREILPADKVRPQPGEWVAIQWTPDLVRYGRFERYSTRSERVAMVRMVTESVVSRKLRAIDSWAIINVVTEAEACS